MSLIRILIVEDEPLYAGQLEMLITELGHTPVGKADNASIALEFVRQHSPDLILMDINLNGDIDGIETAAMIASTTIIPIIFITSMQDDATFDRAKSTLPHAFITKPFSAKKLQRTIELTINRMHERLPFIPNDQEQVPSFKKESLDSFFIKTKNTLEKIILPEVQWVEVTNRDCNIHTLNKTIIVRTPLAELMTKLPYSNFIQVHRSFIVNSNHITSIDLTNNNITIKDKQIPVSKTFKDEILQKLHIL